MLVLPQFFRDTEAMLRSDVFTFLLLCGLGFGSLAAADSAPADPHASVQGMVVSCHGAGAVWGTDAMVDTLVELKELGVNWITIHPYARIRSDGSVIMWERAYRDTKWLTRPIAEAHKLGLKIAIKPHLAYWGSPFPWRGDISFETPEQWQRFFSTYKRWVVEVAAICKNADAFIVGTELDKTTHFEAQWRDIIAGVRQETTATLTYAANWPDYQRVKFWDALDLIGIQAYFPLVDHDRLPEQGELDRAWAGILADLAKYARGQNRKVVFAELGYDRSSGAARKPWRHESGGPHAEETQRRCLAAALRAIRRDDTVVGAFLWKWFPGQSHRGNFLMSTQAMRDEISAQWAAPAGE